MTSIHSHSHQLPAQSNSGGHSTHITPPSNKVGTQVALALLQQSYSWAQRFGDANVAYSNGYLFGKATPNGTYHARNPAFMNDGREYDPSRPEMLTYRYVDGYLQLTGVVYVSEADKKLPVIGNPVQPHFHGTKGREMQHVWFTQDLASAYAHETPIPQVEKAQRAGW